MAINVTRLLKQVKKIVGVQDEEWTTPSLAGSSRLYALSILEDYIPDLVARWRYNFCQGLYTSDSTEPTRKIKITSDDKALIFEKNMVGVEWGKIGDSDLDIKSLLTIQEDELQDGGSVRYGYFEINENTGQVMVRLLSEVAGAQVKAVILKVPKIKAFPDEFHNLFLFQVSEHLLLEKQKNNVDAARAEYLKKLAKKEEDISIKWAFSSRSETDMRVEVSYANSSMFRSGSSRVR